MEQNPYSPPQETRDEPGAAPPPSPAAGLSLSEQGWTAVTSLSRWMRIVATFYLLLGSLIAVGVLALLATGNLASLGGSLRGSWYRPLTTAAAGLFGAAIAVVFVLGGVWLRKAAHGFYDGVLSGAEATLGLGFRKLRLYLILYGAFGLITLAKDVYTLALAASFGGS